jgi:hypothetical protein
MMSRQMGYVMVPVPSEHVREVMGMVLAKSSDSSKNAVRDHARLTRLVEESHDLARSVLEVIARAAIEGSPPSLPATAEAVGQDEAVVLAVLRDLDMRAISRSAALVTVEEDVDDRTSARSARTAYLTMPPERARIVLDTLAARDGSAQ